MRITVLVDVDRPMGQAIGVKESIAMLLERFGDTKVISVTESPEPNRQTSLWGGSNIKKDGTGNGK